MRLVIERGELLRALGHKGEVPSPSFAIPYRHF